jgi:hypothetical protein
LGHTVNTPEPQPLPDARAFPGRIRVRRPARPLRGVPARARTGALALAMLVLAAIPRPGHAERFVLLGVQPDGSEIFVQAEPAAVRGDGALQGWFRTVPKSPQPISDEYGFERRYRDMIALNVADCFNRRMGTTTMVYRDAKGEAVARFDATPGTVDYRPVKPGSLGESMFDWLCSPRPRSAPPPSAAQQSPFK